MGASIAGRSCCASECCLPHTIVMLSILTYAPFPLLLVSAHSRLLPAT